TNFRSHLIDVEGGVAYFASESRTEAAIYALRVDVATGDVETIAHSTYGAFPLAWSADHSRVVLADQYLAGDLVLYEPDGGGGRRRAAVPLRDADRGTRGRA